MVHSTPLTDQPSFELVTKNGIQRLSGKEDLMELWNLIMKLEELT